MTGKKTKKTRRKYDASFKEDVLKMIASGRSVPDVAESLGISNHIIYRWVGLARQDASAGNALSNPFSADIERLKAELHRTQQERDILKKALGIFSRGI
jgi:transposase